MNQLQTLNIRALKGAPLSVLFVLMIQQTPIGMRVIMQETGYSDKSVSQALDTLESYGIITRTGRAAWQLNSNGEYQMPLSWDPTPGLSTGVDNSNISNAGNFPESEIFRKISELEMRIAALENGNSGKNDGNSVLKKAEFPDEVSFFLSDNNLKSEETKKEVKVNSDAEKIPETDPETEKIPEPEHDHVQADRSYFEDRLRAFQKCEMDNLRDVIWNLNPVYEQFDFFVTRCKDGKSLLSWLKLTYPQAKANYLRLIGITGKKNYDITKNDTIGLFDIDYHYQELQKQIALGNTNLTIGSCISRIEKHWDKSKVESFDYDQSSYHSLSAV